jgi:hypothetical protein
MHENEISAIFLQQAINQTTASTATRSAVYSVCAVVK